MSGAVLVAARKGEFVNCPICGSDESNCDCVQAAHDFEEMIDAPDIEEEDAAASESADKQETSLIQERL